AIIGRVAGRIQQAAFSLNGTNYKLSANDLFGHPQKNHLHGGVEGFSFKLWHAETFITEDECEAVRFQLHSPHMEEGYPGNVDVQVTYILTHQNEIQITYSAKADSETVLNLTNHAYFNLGGEVNDYLLTIPSTTIIESNVHLIPSGKLEDISNTALDFSKAKIGYRKNQSIPGALF